MPKQSQTPYQTFRETLTWKTMDNNTPTLSPELQQQIEQEGSDYAKDNRNGDNHNSIKRAHKDAANSWAAKFEHAKKALEDIAALPWDRNCSFADAIATKSLASWKEEGKEGFNVLDKGSE